MWEVYLELRAFLYADREIGRVFDVLSSFDERNWCSSLGGIDRRLGLYSSNCIIHIN